jgi:raffinose/stachyose/melibiose transport system substrate-binding protein
MATPPNGASLVSSGLNRRDFLRVTGVTSLGLAAFLAGCAPAATSTATGSAIIEFLSVQQANQGWPLVLSAIMSEFVKTHPGSTFKVDFVATPADLAQKTQLLGSQRALPILYNTPSNDLLSQLDQSGQVLDLEQTLQQLGALQYLSPAAVAINKKIQLGKLVSLPFELNIEGIWYNKQTFSQNGIQPPQTWDELEQIAASLQQKGIQPFSASGIQGWPITRLIGNYLFRTIGPTALDDVKSGKAKLTDPTYVAAAQVVADLGKKGYFGKGVATLDYTPAEDVFLQGKAAMFYMGSWALRDFNDPTMNKIGSDNVGFFPFPNVTGGAGNSNQIAMNTGQTTSVSKAKYNDAIGQWLALVAKSYGDIALQKEGAVTGFVVQNPPANVPALTTAVLNQITQVSQPVLWFEALFSQKATTISQQNAVPLVTGSMSASDFMASVQQAL